MKDNSMFLEVDFSQKIKQGQNVCGDCFLSKKTEDTKRIVLALSDGLGSGIKANILSSMTATMSLRFVESNMEIIHSAEVMMDTLPICKVRKISYATFTIVDSSLDGRTRIIEMDNPPFILVRNGKIYAVKGKKLLSTKRKDRSIYVSQFSTLPEDRIILLSDGITQAGMGIGATPLGWRIKGCSEYILQRIMKDPEISARRLSKSVIEGALAREHKGLAGDDMTCAVLYYRHPRQLTVFTGPPFRKEDDPVYAELFRNFDGRRIICGGTSAKIIARELHRAIFTRLDTARAGLPPLSEMEGADLITEGILTLTKVLGILEGRESAKSSGAASKLTEMLLESDMINFVVGSRINEAHQDPTLPQELEIRRNIVRNISRILKDKYLKELSVNYI